MKLIQQFYTEPRYVNINGNKAQPQSMMYDPEEVRNAEFDLTIAESTSTPAYRLVMNDFLMQLFQAGQITLNELLENGAFPFADKLLQTIQARQEQAQQAQQEMMMAQQAQQAMPTEQEQFIPDDIRQAIEQNANPEILQMLMEASQQPQQ